MEKKTNAAVSDIAKEDAIDGQDSIKKFALIDEDGRPKAFYSSDVNKDIPSEAVEISHDQWMEFINNPGVRRFQNQKIVSAPAVIEKMNPAQIRNKRSALLRESDWTQLPDAPFTNEEKQKWAEYRQALRDLDISDLDNIIWPVAPSV